MTAVTAKTTATLPSSGQLNNMMNDPALQKAILCTKQKWIYMVQSWRLNKYFDFTSATDYFTLLHLQQQKMKKGKAAACAKSSERVYSFTTLSSRHLVYNSNFHSYDSFYLETNIVSRFFKGIYSIVHKLGFSLMKSLFYDVQNDAKASAST